MFLVENIRRNICRYRVKSLINLCICAMAVVLLNIYFGNLASSEQQLAELSEIMPVTACVSNLNGSQSVGLEIKEKTIKGIQQSPYIEDLVLSMQLAGAEGEFPRDQWKQYLNLPIQAANSVKGVLGLEWENIRLAEDVPRDFLESSKPYILVSNEALERNGWKVGDMIHLTMYYYVSGKYGIIDWDFLSTEDFRIAGTMDITDFSSDVLPMDAVVPFAWAEDAFQENHLSYLADSAAFKLKNSEDLNAFKKEMKELQLLEIVTTADTDVAGIALMVRDGTYINSATRLRENIVLLKGFLPLMLLVVMGVGYITSYLLVQSRQGEYALMRAIGMSKAGCFIQRFLEHLAVEIVGGVLGVVISIILYPVRWQTLLETLTVFLLCYMCGTAAALWMQGRVTVIAALTQGE